MDFDLILVGGGLASGLAGLRLAARRPELRVAIVEASDRIGGDHIWSSFDTDMTPAQREWTAPLYAARWPRYDVRFPAFARTLEQGYASARSENLDAAVRAAIPAERLLLGSRVRSLDATGVTLESGERIEARVVINGRGHAPTTAMELAWQKFVGLEIETLRPHGIDAPIIMDACVDQAEGYRFIYVLPWDARRLLIEDTYYSDGPDLDIEAVKARIAEWAMGAGLGPYGVVRTERGVLPLALGGNIDALWDAGTPGVARLGMRAGLFHPLTGYSFLDAVRTADLLADLPRFDPDLVYNALRAHATRTWQGRRYYRMLARMLFRAAEPPARYRVLQHFYRLPEALVARFYAGRSTRTDKLRVLAGRPPVPPGRALAVMLGLD
ncbi:lycopene beta-cyclase CrtY [Sphingosinicella soli]|uniref:Lycopene beta-cyclase n=1 Tax=Sphingosinicella soli TaxID=333708 RepID=A0A7W7F8B6_9SPHN|nr:lycopene beta-cyclase CrtY [Sphingosinicella soli]MBB4633502.1 lycopene beta-cyclase [Sphingosinicella soli]